ncbi:alcohol dehydrogenase catalytic domain-containing protein [Streptomyces violaceus]|uniref:Alcohol dehydrogenase catalytic domain-containing protein n=1 Tax=Streptomyces violaceus TaxID=1936 RepID=A0ABZ1NJL2_STRVL
MPVEVAWLRRTNGDCAYCARGAENLGPRSEFTGWYADGGYAEYMTVPAAFAYRPIECRTTNWRRAAEGAAV